MQRISPQPRIGWPLTGNRAGPVPAIKGRFDWPLMVGLRRLPVGIHSRKLSLPLRAILSYAAAFAGSAATFSIRKPCALLAWLAAVNIAFLSFLSTRSQESI